MILSSYPFIFFPFPPPLLSFFQSQLNYVCNIINETLVENNVNVFEDIPQEIKDQLQVYFFFQFFIIVS